MSKGEWEAEAFLFPSLNKAQLQVRKERACGPAEELLAQQRPPVWGMTLKAGTEKHQARAAGRLWCLHITLMQPCWRHGEEGLPNAGSPRLDLEHRAPCGPEPAQVMRKRWQ